MCIFSTHNLIKDPPFSRLDLIVCRNLLIYLEADLQQHVTSLFHYALRPGGYLFLGPVGEPRRGRPTSSRTVDKKHRDLPAQRDGGPARRWRSAPTDRGPAPRRHDRGRPRVATPGQAEMVAGLERAPARPLRARLGHHQRPGRGRLLLRRARASYLEPAGGHAQHGRRQHGAQGPAPRPAHRHPQGAEDRRGAWCARASTWPTNGERPAHQPGRAGPSARARATDARLFLVVFQEVRPRRRPRDQRPPEGAAATDGRPDRPAARERAAHDQGAPPGHHRGGGDLQRGAEVVATRSCSPPTRSCSPPTRSSRPPRRSCSRSTRSWRRSTPS